MNIHTQHTIRSADASDSIHLAKLIDIAGEGIPNWLWARSCVAGQTPLEIGMERAQRKTGGFSYRNAQIAELNGRPAGMVLSYGIDEAPTEELTDLPDPIAPFVELEKHSVDTWYINALAVFAGLRNGGIGHALMKQAERTAQASGYSQMSIQVYGQNSGAVRLYKSLGYKQTHKAPVLSHPCQPYYTGDVLLLKKSLVQ